MKRINKKKFWDIARKKAIFHTGVLSQAVKSTEAIIDGFEERNLPDYRYLGYMLATARGEVGIAMSPVREGFAKSDSAARKHVLRQGYKYAKEVNGHVYYGRGLVQLTWDYNYKSMGTILGIDLYNDPDRALEPAIAAQIMFEGMTRGTFTTKKLSDYFNAKKDDPKGARKIINGTDRDDEFASFYRDFMDAINGSLEEVAEKKEEGKKKWYEIF